MLDVNLYLYVTCILQSVNNKLKKVKQRVHAENHINTCTNIQVYVCHYTATKLIYVGS